MKHVKIMGIPFTHITHRTLVQKLEEHIRLGEKSFIITANPEIVMHANADYEYMRSIHKANYITADGIGIIRASQLMKEPLPERVTGYDVMIDMLEIAEKEQYKIFLLGAHPDVLNRVEANIQKYYPNVEIVGKHDGYFDWNHNDVAEQVKEANPDLTFVALGAPKQEKWIAQNIDQFEKGVFLCVGGSFDVIGGVVKRAPAYWRNNDIEWLYRLLKQPKRWRRMLALPRFAYRVIKQKLKGCL
ncbi:WecB/TagA/CpsF family glycosyltransferase [Halobacillus yeomjeoni]|uniref:N-acetylglucosaminyldiphosphoundecaprenol N-acetyl-beta-D-mannosaminyltransferase n=1 Tax=Halobacillus yeomjeoni TaxID=311194 RepID=A0A931HVT6_9BACI|nr:WecB/TagA/CpsF family glycosyltransferase [Halobacillus yeomjeoni]MBH0230717.1 WecB/TagA/CpsF family glycosyltransferase [Halobacillus yeomjeoni]